MTHTPGTRPEDYHHYAHWYAGTLVNRSSLAYDDLVQEGLIRAWRVLGTSTPANTKYAPYVTRSIRSHLAGIASGRPMVGGNHRPGPRTEPPNLTSLDALLEADTDHNERLVEDAGLLDGIELAYHQGTLAQAIDSLAPADRRYVVLRFWHSMGDTEIAARIGHHNRYWHTRWTRTIRPHLRARLTMFDDYY